MESSLCKNPITAHTVNGTYCVIAQWLDSTSTIMTADQIRTIMESS